MQQSQSATHRIVLISDMGGRITRILHKTSDTSDARDAYDREFKRYQNRAGLRVKMQSRFGDRWVTVMSEGR
jgi:hypothetical protein